MSGALEGSTILVVEDDYLLATDIERVLRGAGAKVCGPFAHGGDGAADVIERGEANCALLDINLGGEFSFDLAARLQERGVPFAFVTGYESVPEAWRHVPLVNKPAAAEDVVRTAAALLSGSLR